MTAVPYSLVAVDKTARSYELQRAGVAIGTVQVAGDAATLRISQASLQVRDESASTPDGNDRGVLQRLSDALHLARRYRLIQDGRELAQARRHWGAHAADDYIEMWPASGGPSWQLRLRALTDPVADLSHGGRAVGTVRVARNGGGEVSIEAAGLDEPLFAFLLYVVQRCWGRGADLDRRHRRSHRCDASDSIERSLRQRDHMARSGDKARSRHFAIAQVVLALALGTWCAAPLVWDARALPREAAVYGGAALVAAFCLGRIVDRGVGIYRVSRSIWRKFSAPRAGQITAQAPAQSDVALRLLLNIGTTLVAATVAGHQLSVHLGQEPPEAGALRFLAAAGALSLLTPKARRAAMLSYGGRRPKRRF